MGPPGDHPVNAKLPVRSFTDTLLLHTTPGHGGRLRTAEYARHSMDGFKNATRREKKTLGRVDKRNYLVRLTKLQLVLEVVNCDAWSRGINGSRATRPSGKKGGKNSILHGPVLTGARAKKRYVTNCLFFFLKQEKRDRQLGKGTS